MQPGTPYGSFNLLDLSVGDLRKGSSFAFGDLALVLQNHPDQERSATVRHIYDIENGTKCRIEYGKESYLVTQIVADGFFDAFI